MASHWKSTGSSEGAVLRWPSTIVFANPNGDGYLLEVQTDLLDELKTRVVVPLIPHSSEIKTLRRLNPVFTIGGKQYAMFTHLIADRPSQPIGRAAD